VALLFVDLQRRFVHALEETREGHSGSERVIGVDSKL
jgi:hypothetical protein